MSFESQVSENLLKFERDIKEIKSLLANKKYEQVLRQAQDLAMFAWHHSMGLFASSELEQLIAGVSGHLPVLKNGVSAPSKQRRILTIMTNVSASGGHSRIAWRWIELDKNSHHTLVLTQQIDPVPVQLQALSEEGRLTIVVLNSPTLLERASHLRQRINDADRVVLLIHPHDVLANAALAGMKTPPPVIFQDHAAHTFWLGATVSNIVLSMSAALLNSRRGIAKENIGWIPIPLDFQRLEKAAVRDIRAECAIDKDAFVLMSCGSPYKYLPIEGVCLADLLAPVLEKNPGAHLILVGPDLTAPWAEFSARFPGRVHCIGHLFEESLVAAYTACDVYLDAVPFTSPTALFEAAAMGKPVVRFAPAAWRACEFALDIEATMPTSLYVWSDAPSYQRDIQRLMDDRAFREWRGLFGHTATRLYHADETFVHSLEAAYDRAAVLPKICLDPVLSAARFELFDRLELQLAQNMALQVGLDHEYRQQGLLKKNGPLRIAVALHLYYVEQWDDIRELLKNIPFPFDLFVTTTAENKHIVSELLALHFPDAKLYITANRGRDIGPLFGLLQYENLAAYDFVCKLHTKKSPHLDPELVQKWREELLISLLPSKEGVQAIFDLFNTRPEVGIVTGAGVLVHAHYTPGGNIGLLRELAARLGFNLDEMAYEFPGGSMFWCRGRIFNSLNALNISEEDFEPESGQTNGTLAHAIERIFPLIAYHQGLLTVDSGYQGNVPNPRFPNSSEEYLHWLSKQELCIPEAKLFDWHAEAVALPEVKICIVDRFANKSGLIETINSVSRQFYANVKLLVCSSSANPMPKSGVEWIQVQDGFYSAILNTLAHQDGGWLGVLEAGDQLTMSGLLLAMHQLVDHPEWKLVYFDDDVMNADGRPACPRFKPDFDINLLRSIPYADGFLLLRSAADFSDVYAEMEGWGAEQLALLLHCYEQDGAGAIGHIPEVLTHLQINESRQLSNPLRYKAFSDLIDLHLQRQNVVAEILPNGRVEGALRVKYALPEQPLVSIIIPTKNQLPMLQRCIESILEKTSYPNYEIIIIDNNSDDPLVLPYLEQLELLLSDRLRVFEYPHAFNFSAINNAAVGQANGDYLVLLNNDTAIIQNSWLEELLHHAMRPEVGIVGAKLLYPNGLVQHAGVVLGLRGPADHPCIGASLEESGYMHRLQLDQQYSVVTAACMMVRKSVYEQAGGMDEVDFKVSYNDVDLCLKVRALGYSTVWTPYSVVMHEGSVSQSQINPDKAAAKQLRFEGEQVAMYRKWLPEIGNDPAYNKNLTLSGNGFELEHRSLLSWRPLSWKPLPTVLCHPADQTGCGQYRILQPFAAMLEAQKIAGAIAFELFPAFELAKLAPDVMVFQRQISAQQIDFLRLSKACSPSFKVYELDDYLPNIPIKSAHRAHMPKDVVKSLRKALTFVDRFTVSTDELANAYEGMHSVMHVVNNYLPVPIWGNLQSERNQGKKPRVGWAGGASHTGDLELIESVVKALAHEVEWVFFGMCPDKLRPFVHEFHAGVPIGLYPAKLASLNLDLALAPLEQNIFNQCKSNLRLLEYGACGFPVICTDIAPYRGSLPVTRVRNKHKDWVDAIRDHLSDPDSRAESGRVLKEAVLKDWMLDGANLDKWRAAWLPA
ncbi:rhamnan synthesis F family protein [Iodobacter sp. BJB302]|uniref:rhamnan synthesis F family protein n=1 Tax=Iodobacter sp. BJB302 TaxID=1506510 RepID=UPI0015D47F23|nr:rhamnan synthesis F family protein [Iodobacter sp. BJB302]